MITYQKNKIFIWYFEIWAYLCGVRTTYRRCKRAGQEMIESIGSSIIIRSYISDVCGSDRLGLCRTAFLFIHLMSEPDENSKLIVC